MTRGLNPWYSRIGDEEMATKESLRKMERDKLYTRFYGIKLNQHTDPDVIARLDAQPSMQGYIKRLIREDIAREQAAKRKDGGAD